MKYENVLQQEQLPLYSFPYQLLSGLMAQLSHKILSHVSQPYQLGVQQVQLHSLQETANTPSSTSSSGIVGRGWSVTSSVPSPCQANLEAEERPKNDLRDVNLVLVQLVNRPSSP